MTSVRFPGETAEYRAARDELLKAESELRRRTEEVAAQRRELPLGGAIPSDYVFDEGGDALSDTETKRAVKMSELFSNGKTTLVIYSFMFGPKMERACPMCTSVIDGLQGNAVHVQQRVGLVIVAKSPIERLRDYARTRGWSHLRLLSSAANDFNRDYHAEEPHGGQTSILHVFSKREGKVHHTWSSELAFADHPQGQNSRHVDPIWPLWNLLDCTPEGRGESWYPKIQY